MFYFSGFILKKNHGFIQEGNPSEKAVIVVEELYSIDKDNIGNLKDPPRLMFINEKCEDLILVNDGGKLTRNINQKKKSDILQYSIDVHYVTNAVGKSISSVTMWNIVNQLGKHDVSCGQ